MNVTLTNTAKKLCVIGDPVTHSKSPLLHNTMCQALGLDYLYLCQTVKPGGLADFLTGAKALGYAGFNATMPFKELLLPHLDELDPLATKLGAVNTVCIKGGKLYGYNTDCPGYVAALRRRGFDPAGKRAVLLGAGGAAKAVALGLCEAGAEVSVLNRTPDRAQAVAALCPGQAVALPWTGDTLTQVLPRADLLVNATSLGMAGQGQFENFDFLELLPETCLVSDLIYHPAPTELLRRAAARGLSTMDGFPLLIHQAILALEHFTGQSIPVDAALPALERAVGAQG